MVKLFVKVHFYTFTVILNIAATLLVQIEINTCQKICVNNFLFGIFVNY